MMRKLSLGGRLALLFAACTAAVSLTAGVLFSRASERHFIELDQQLLESRLSVLRQLLEGVADPASLALRLPALESELSHQTDLAVRVRGSDGQVWFDSQEKLPDSPRVPGVSTVHSPSSDYRSLCVNLNNADPQSAQLTLFLDITHHQHFLQRMQQLIWLTVGLSALATALLGAWAARSGLRPLRQMGEVASKVSARSLTTRLPAEQMPVELAELAQTVNAMLERLDNAFQRLSAFSADIAHELRTPLSNLLTHTQVTLTRPRGLEEYREALHSNLEELQWMAQLVNDMLYLAKADHGLLMPSRQYLDLHDEADALIEYYAPLAEDAGVTLSREGMASLEGDRHMLRRALSNLLDNALRFTPPAGEIRVNIQVHDHQMQLQVANTGEPIDPSLLPRLFDRFYRADPARREGSSEHAGLGLAITRSIVQAHGGNIRAESVGGWTRFVISLPAV
ncbi:heavy metal sensor histidine kinase [Pseudomonas auratipiscis]|uniref:Sensor protein n=1 Tax=Pseudomonas auratipiscis TaxID=3115853 RepID=A0AB35WWJ6_9PSED|nr:MULTISPECIES: heavy metal sensor histidine kinase [unclassified Pseudomonas]MEE1869003.1 heavy metal sensor histidine kinase [Pseudomonas sp. 120P]MEE1959650.1 heavy metal sensor histidine kinase [Pseudomonas sp. 119P]